MSRLPHIHAIMLAIVAGLTATGMLIGFQQEASPSSVVREEGEVLSEKTVLTKIAFGSCADQNLPQPIWRAIQDENPQLFIFMGDNVYGDVSSPAMTELRKAYARLNNIPGFRRLWANTPVLSIWDDHDYGSDDGGAQFALRGRAEELFLEFWQVQRTSPRARREGLYDAGIYGPEGQRVQIILLDTRTFRSELKPTDERGAPGKERYLPDTNPEKTMLGTIQWEWLGEQLQKPAELRLIVSSIQVIADGHGFERWGNFPLERQKLYDLIAETRADGVVILSGDRHFGALYRESGNLPYPLYEITSSSLNRPFRSANERGPNQLGDVYGEENYGTLNIDWAEKKLRLNLHGIRGGIVRSVTVDFGALQAASRF